MNEKVTSLHSTDKPAGDMGKGTGHKAKTSRFSVAEAKLVRQAA